MARYSRVPELLILDLRISPLAVRLWARIERFQGANAAAYASRAVLAEELGVSEATIKRALAELTGSGWATRQERAGGSWETVVHASPITEDHGSPVTRESARPRVTSDPRPRVTSDPTTGHQRPEGGSPVTRGGVTSDPQKEHHLRNPTQGTPSGLFVAKTPTPKAAPDGDQEKLAFDVEIVAPKITAQPFVAAYVDAVEASGGLATTSMRRAIGSNVKRILREDDIPMPVLLLAAKRAGERRARTIDVFLGESQTLANRDGAARKAMFAAWDQIAADLTAKGF